MTATYLARADQLEIKIAQGSKPGEGGQLPGRKATAYIAALRRGQPGQSYISPPPHHDIYSIEDLAQLIADLRAINPSARIGVKLVAGRGVGTIAAGVAKAGASYIHLSGHAGGTGASPLSSIKHVGAPWELGLAEVHQMLLRNDLRDRVALRTDGGLQTGRDLLVAALLGAEEFAFGTAALVAIGCDMARQCHLDTCPTGIATQREDLRAKFAGTPDDVVRYFTAIAEDLRRELAAVGARSVGEIVGESRRLLRAVADGARRAGAGHRGGAVGCLAGAPRGPVVGRARRRACPRVGRSRPAIATAFRGQGSVTASGLRVTTADRSFGAGLTGALERGELHGPIRLELVGAAGQSFGAFAGPGVELRLVGQANDYVAKGLSGGSISVAPEPDLGTDAASEAIAGNTVPVRGDRRPAPPRRPGGDALRGPQQRRRGGRRGDRPARLRVHDRRHGRRPRTGRRELRRRDDRRTSLPVRPDRPPHGRARRAQRAAPSGSRPRSPTGPTAQARLVELHPAARARSGPPDPRWPDACSTTADLAVAVLAGRADRPAVADAVATAPVVRLPAAPSQPDRNPIAPGSLPTAEPVVAYPRVDRGAASPPGDRPSPWSRPMPRPSPKPGRCHR